MTASTNSIDYHPDLVARDQWVCWRYETREGMRTKVPYNARTGNKANSTDRTTWSRFDVVLSAWRRSVGHYAGIGSVFAADDPFFGIDLDHCRDAATGEVVPWAQDILTLLDSYAELSPSGEGIHVWVRAGEVGPRRVGSIDGHKIEMYPHGRFFTVTGHRLVGTPATINDRQEQLAALYARVFAPTEKPANGNGAAMGLAHTVTLDDAAILELARKAKNWPKIERLLTGNSSDYGDDESSADAALAACLAFYTDDAGQIERIMRASDLARAKWDSPRGQSTYLTETIANTLMMPRERYQPKHDEATPIPAAVAALTVTGDTAAAESIALTPVLPAAAQLTDAMQKAADSAGSWWLTPYCDLARILSPRTPRALHEDAAIFAACMAIARRVFLVAGPKRFYPALFLLFVGRSTLSGKTTALLDVLRRIIVDAGLGDLLLPASFTPQALLADLALHVPSQVRDGPADTQTRWLERHRHAAQRGVIRDEVSGIFEDCAKDYNTGLLPLLLKLDGAPDYVDSDLTVSRGLVEVRDVGINLIGATTPAALRDHAAKAYHWANGLFGRFCISEPDEPARWAFWSCDDAQPQINKVVALLHRIYESLPAPSADFDYGLAKDGMPAPIVGAKQLGYAARQATITEEAWQAWERYAYALFTLAESKTANERLDPTYGRLPSAAIRVALTLAVTEWALSSDDRQARICVEMRHWAAAQQIAERWRYATHRVLATALLSEDAESQAKQLDRLVSVLGEQGGRSKRGDIQRRLNWTSEQLTRAIIASGGRVVERSEKTKGRPAEWVELAAIPVSPEPTGLSGSKADFSAFDAFPSLVPLPDSAQTEVPAATNDLYSDESDQTTKRLKALKSVPDEPCGSSPTPNTTVEDVEEGLIE
jgi:hypothetical protein